MTDHLPSRTTRVSRDAGLERLYDALLVARGMRPSAATVLAYRDAHRLVWDMPSLGELYPEIVRHLRIRYAFEQVADTIVVDHLSGEPSESYETEDVRFVVDVLLTREYRQALWDDRVEPAFRRLSE